MADIISDDDDDYQNPLYGLDKTPKTRNDLDFSRIDILTYFCIIRLDCSSCLFLILYSMNHKFSFDDKKRRRGTRNGEDGSFVDAASGAKSRGRRGHRPAPAQTLPSPPPTPFGETISLKNPPARRIIEVNLDNLSRRLYRRVGAPGVHIHNR
ncbi:unnamed protein product [Euphydryas editha]|uniref:Uncharacterized protein n=1 Tax=Euphydryas editha TaxID=104508 RepID=A0AAU9TZ65_EUPED|nr:unnamed protein product [Euphydryas editha]